MRRPPRRRSRLLPLWLGVAVLAAGPARGAPMPADPAPQYAFRTFDKGNSGIPQSTPTSLLEDDQGTLWIGTFEGLGRYEGLAIESVSAVAEAPVVDIVNCLVARRGGGFYAGSQRGVHVYDGRNWTLLPTSHAVRSIAEVPGGGLWVVDLDGEVFFAATGSSHWQKRSFPELTSPALEVATRGDAVWIASIHEVIRLAGERPPQVVGGGRPEEPISSFLLARDGTAWVGTTDGRLLHAGPAPPASWQPIDLPGWTGGRVFTLAEDLAHRVWAGGAAGNVAFGAARAPWTVWGPAQGLRRSMVTSILADREGHMWFGFNGAGLQELTAEDWTHLTTLDPAESDPRLIVFAINPRHSGGFLAGAFDHGLLVWDGARLRRFGRDSGLSEDVRFPVETAPGRIWVGARNGIFEGTLERGFRRTLALSSGFVLVIAKSPAGEWLAGTSSRGIYRRVDGVWQPADDLNRGLPDLDVRAIAWPRRGELWVGTMRGLSIFGDGPPRTLDQERDGVPRSVLCILAASPDEMWLGGIGGLGIRGAHGNRFLGPSDGAPGKTVYALAAAPGGDVWASGSGGVTRFHGTEVTHWDRRNGMINEECNNDGLLVDADGSLWVGTMGSLGHLRPHGAPPPPPLRVYWRPPTPPGGHLQLAPGGRHTDLRWSAPWLGPERVEYRTRVPRTADAWSDPTPLHDLVLGGLSAGTWTVEVEARLPNGPWSAPIAATVEVPPRLWERSAFHVAVLLALAGLATILTRLRTRQLRRRAQALQLAVDAALANVKTLSGLLPICSACKKVRDDGCYWQQIEAYIRDRSEAEFSHSICPDCFARLYPDYPAAGPQAEPPGHETR